MDASKIVAEAIQEGVYLFVDSSRLAYKARKGGLSASLRAKLQQHKREIEAYLDAKRTDVPVSTMPPMERLRRDGELLASYAQQRLWLLDQIDGGSSQYNLPVALRLKGELDRDALQRALDSIVERHEVLRTRFTSASGQPLQVIEELRRVEIAEVDLSGWSETARERELSRLQSQEVNRPFDLSKDLMLRATVVVLSPDDHVLLFTQHHIASDGWSLGIVVREFRALYEAYAQGRSNPLGELPIQYADYAQWQRQWLQGEELERHLKYWEQELSGIEAVHSLPLDYARGAVQSPAGGVKEQWLEAELTSGLKALSQAQQVTMFMLLQTAFALWVSRYSGESRVVIGTPIAGRSHAQVEGLIGFFVNNLVLSSRFESNEPFGSVLQTQKEKILQAYGHQEVPFELLVERLNPQRSLSHDPIFQIVFGYDNNEVGELSLPKLRIEALAAPQVLAKVDLELVVRERDGRLWIGWTYRKELFAAGSIEAMSQSFERLLRGIVAQPQRGIHEYELLSEEQAAQVRAQGRGAAVPTDGRSVLERFEEQARTIPDAVAGICGEERLSYRELNEKAQRLASYLVQAGLSRQARVGIYLPRGLEMLIAVLGVMKAGGTYVPLERSWPSKRLEYVLRDAGVQWVLLKSSWLEGLGLGGVDVVLMDGAGSEAEWLEEYGEAAEADHSRAPARTNSFRELQVSRAEAEQRRAQSTDAAYVLYTSGSTGEPKGVVIEHGGLLNYVTHAAREYLAPELQGSVVSSPLGFDATLTTLLTPLMLGKAVELLPEEDESLEFLRQRLFAEEAGSWLFKITPAHLEALDALQEQAGSQAGNQSHVVVVGGEQLSVRVLRRWKQKWLPRAVFVNEYGPTETVVGCSTYTVRELEELEKLDGAAVPIGRAIGNVQLYVVGPGQQLQPVQCVGELYIGGAGVARGYLGRPELTSERFVKDCLSGAGRLYRSGDLVRWLPSGELEFIGRRDEQVKIRGYRIELGEIEQALSGLPGVSASVVMAREGAGGQKQLVAYVVPGEAVEESRRAEKVAEYRQVLSERLPQYMVPTSFVLLEQLPLTANGKVDRKALPSPDSDDLRAMPYTSSRTAAEERLCKIWSELLDVERVSIHDNFFALGGDSILAIQMVARANRSGLGLTTRELFANQTIAELARHARHASPQMEQQSAVAGLLTLTPIQRAFFAEDSASVHHYNQAVLLRTAAPLAPETLRDVVDALYRRHDALRLRFQLQDQQWQAHHEPLSDDMVSSSCWHEALPAQEAAWPIFLAARCEFHQRSLNISDGPMFRVIHFHSESEGRLLIVVHHLVVDGVSWRILLRDISQFLQQRRLRQEVVPPPKSSSYQKWGAALAEYATSQSLQAELNYWRSQWMDAVPQNTDARPILSSAIRTARFDLSAERTEVLIKRCPATYRTGVIELLLAGVYWGMRQWSKQPRLLIELESHGREPLFDSLDVTETVGWFTATYPLSIHSEQEDIASVIKAAKELYRRVPHHGIGYGVLRYLLQDPTLMASEAEHAAPVLFNYLGQFEESFDTSGELTLATEPTGSLSDPLRRRRHPLVFNGGVLAGALQFHIGYDEGTYEESAIRALVRHIETGLQQVIDHCTAVRKGEFTCSDFPSANVDPAELDIWQRQYAIQKLYPSTPMQRGMWFYSLLDRSAYVTQISLTFDGDVNMTCLRNAWQAVLNHHDIFRTAFVGDGTHQHQLVVERAVVPWHDEDWRSLAPVDQEEQFARFLREDRTQGFTSGEPPLVRVSLFRLGASRYRMVWSHHHSLLDGWSTPLVYRDLMQAYCSLLQGKRPQLPQTPQYERYIEWLLTQDEESAARYWREYLRGVDAPTPLPGIKQANEQARRHETRIIDVGRDRTEQLRSTARRYKTTVNTLVQLAWGLLLHRYSGESKVVFGAVVAGRPAEIADVETMVGLFINSLPVVLDFEQERDVASLLAGLQSSFQTSMTYGYLPLTAIQKESPLKGGVPLFDSLLVFENYPLDSVVSTIPDVRIAQAAAHVEDTSPIALSVIDGEALTFSCNYFGDLLSGAAIEQVLERLLYILDQLSTCGTTKQIALLKPEEVEQELARNGTRVELDGRSVLERFEEQARATPDAVAGICAGERLSYRELNEKAQRLASYLVQAGLSRQARVGIHLPRGLEMLIAVLGVMKAGGTYVPLERSWPSKRLEYVFKDAKVQWVLLSSPWLEGVALGGVDVVLMDGAGSEAGWLEEYGEAAEADHIRAPARTNGCQEVEVSGAEAEQRRAQSTDAAYVLYTSGSTGEPKGVVIEHGGLLNYVTHAAREYLAPELQGSVVSSPLGFDATLTTLLAPLVVGKTVQLVSEEEDESLEGLRQRLFAEGEGSWLFKITPAHLEALEGLQEQAGGRSGTQSHWIVVGGEQLSVRVLRRWKQQWLPRAVFVNEYGPTETVVGCSTYTVRELEELERLDGAAVPIGRAIGNVQLYVVGPGQQLQPVQCVGELYIGGAGVARGYLGRPELTSERFVQDWLSGAGHLYRSGDLARWLSNGELEFIGRRDEQVKIRGYRIELGEIEQALSGLPGVSASVVMAREGAGGQKQLVAYVVPSEAAKESRKAEKVSEYRQALSERPPQDMVPSDAVVDESRKAEKVSEYRQALRERLPRDMVPSDVVAEESRRAEKVAEYRQALSKRLPQYMVPSAFVLLEQLPLTANGKVDRKALPEVQEQASLQAYVAPRDDLERALCEVWQEVLGRQQVGIGDNFFSVGGDSILSIRIVALLRRRGWQVGVKELFEYQTIEELAPRVQRSQPGEEREHQPFELLSEVERERLGKDVVEAYPLSALQAGMVFHTQVEQFSGIYHDIMCEHVRCEWNQACFEQALELCVQEHPVLRSGFVLEGERPLQVVYERVALPLEVQDLKGLSETQQSEYLSEWVERRKRHEFDWERGPLCSIHVFLRSEASFEFVMSFHHAVLDGWSRASLTTQLYQRYERLLRGESVSAGEVNWTYREFLELEQQVLASDAAKGYFAGLLEEAPVVQLPRLRATPEGSGSQRYEVVEGFGALSGRLLELSRRLGVPLQSVLLAVHLKVLSTLSGQSRVLSCVTYNGRPERADAERAVGMFLNSVPLAMELKGCSWRALIEQVSQLSRECMAYRHYPLLQIQRDLGRTFSEVLFNYTHFHVYQELGGEGRLEALGSSGFERNNFDLMVDVIRGIDEGSARMVLVYTPEVLDDALMKSFAECYLSACEAMLEDLDRTHHSQLLIKQPHIRRLTQELNATYAVYPRSRCLHELFEEQVRRTPSAVALVCEDRQLTYTELNERANRLAHHLRRWGVKPEKLVGVCVQRSPEMVIAMLAILKSGGAYVPLDPSYPPQRLAYMVKDSGMEVMLTQTNSAAVLSGLEGVRRIELDEESTLTTLRQEPSEDLERTAGQSASNLAYVIYTSGSTGQPKGVMIEHRAAVNLICGMKSRLPSVGGRRWLLLTSISFDIALYEWMGALTSGDCCVIASETQYQDVYRLRQLLDREEIGLIQATPSRWQQLLDAGWRAKQRPLGLCGGEALTGELERGLREAGVWLWNCYGPTEATVWSLLHEVREGDSPRTRVSLGRGLPNYRHLVLDEQQQLVPFGAVGELYIGGESVARGYWGRAELTEQRFISDPYEEKGRLYRTGDRVRYLADGNLEFLGRIDHQVKIRGYRIELGEIEQQLCAVAAVRSAVVVARNDASGGKSLFAYLVANRGVGHAETDQDLIAALHADLKTRLPEYMIPSAFVVLDELPLTPNGKIDRNALPAAGVTLPTHIHVAPATATEVAMTELWAAVLQRDPGEISAEADFIALGGHSLLLMRLTSALREHFQVHVSIAWVHERMQLRALARGIDALRSKERIEQQLTTVPGEELQEMEF